MTPPTGPTPPPIAVPRPPERVDAVIVGAGASGLSLACHLAASPWGARHDVVVVDDGAHDPADRAWAYWSTGDGLLDPVARARFERFAVHSPTRSHVRTLDAYRYLAVRGEDLARAAATALTATPRVRRVTGHVTAIHDDDGGAHVLVATPAHGTHGTHGTHTVRARWVFDSTGIGGRPGPPPTGTGRLDFRGHRVETPTDVFDPTTPTLMDFRTDPGAGLGFGYVLPESARVALVEHTRFVVGPTAGPSPDQTGAVETYLREVLGVSEHRVLGVERGSIPLRTHPARLPTAHVVPIGAPAGMVKASTGYGFGRIQRHSAALTRSLVAHGHPFDVPAPSRRHRRLDALLLDVVAHEPGAVVDVFMRMFARNRADRVLAFLDEDTSVAEELALILTLPPGPFLRRLVARGARRRVSPGSAPTGGAARRRRDPGSRST